MWCSRRARPSTTEYYYCFLCKTATLDTNEHMCRTCNAQLFKATGPLATPPPPPPDLSRLFQNETWVKETMPPYGPPNNRAHCLYLALRPEFLTYVQGLKHGHGWIGPGLCHGDVAFGSYVPLYDTMDGASAALFAIEWAHSVEIPERATYMILELKFSIVELFEYIRSGDLQRAWGDNHNAQGYWKLLKQDGWELEYLDAHRVHVISPLHDVDVDVTCMRTCPMA